MLMLPTRGLLSSAIISLKPFLKLLSPVDRDERSQLSRGHFEAFAHCHFLWMYCLNFAACARAPAGAVALSPRREPWEAISQGPQPRQGRRNLWLGNRLIGVFSPRPGLTFQVGRKPTAHAVG